MAKNPSANAGDAKDGFDPWLGKIPWSIHFSILAWKMSWAEEPGRL